MSSVPMKPLSPVSSLWIAKPPALVTAFSMLLATWAPASVRAQEVLTPKHIAKLRGVTSVAVSPDGAHVAYTLAVPRELLKEESGPPWIELHVADASGRSRPFVTGKVNVSAVDWMPDGQSISYLAKREGDKEPALYAIPLGGGESRKLIEHESAISAYAFSPDGRRVAFLAPKPLDKKQKELKEKGFNQMVYEEDWQPTLVWVAEVHLDGGSAGASGDEKSKPKSLALEGSASSLRWSPAGPRLLVALAPTPLVDDWYMKRRLHVVNAYTAAVEARVNNPGKLGDAVWSPDGRHIALVTGEDENDPKDGRLWVVPASGGSHVDLLPSYEGHVSAIGWRDAEWVLYVGDEGVTTVVGEVRRDGSERRTLLAPAAATWAALSLSRALPGTTTTVALVGDAPHHPEEVFLWKLGEPAPRRLTDSNPWLAKIRLARQEVVRHRARDGLELEGILVRPLDEEPGRRYPLILTVHGGPEAHNRNGWVTRYSSPGQVAAARGFAVFYPNYRGSTGRGVRFSKLGQADAAGKEFSDLIDAVDHLVEIGLVDKSKVGVTGGSYGGYASAWCATYYSERFAASVMFVGISDNVSKLGTTDIPEEMYLVHHRKRLWEDWKYFLERSPIYHVQNGRTPLLVLHGKDDPRVHPSQSMELFRHLKTLGKAPVRLVFYPGEGHGNRKSASRYDYNLRLLRWMEHYLKGPGGAAPPFELDYELEAPKAGEEAGTRRRL